MTLNHTPESQKEIERKFDESARLSFERRLLSQRYVNLGALDAIAAIAVVVVIIAFLVALNAVSGGDIR